MKLQLKLKVEKMAKSNSAEAIPGGGKGVDLFAVTCRNVS
jgi:hypothetical protein